MTANDKMSKVYKNVSVRYLVIFAVVPLQYLLYVLLPPTNYCMTVGIDKA